MFDAVQTVVETPFGALRGMTTDSVSCFRRVPYAEPPVGARRFGVPGAPVSWTGTRDATAPGPVPPQLPSRLDGIMGSYIAGLDEDCLHLDIWSPVAADASAPVLVFIHGGAFMTGGGSSPCYDGRDLARKTGLVVVNVTYRLGPLGFLSLPGFAPANLGLHDQIAALKWIRQAIGAFGGNPEAITVAGQSAGSFSIAVMLANDACKGLFKRAILMSAPLGLKLREAGQAPPMAQAILRVLGHDPNEPDLLRTLPVGQIMEAMRLLQRRQPVPDVPGDVTPPFMPVLDGTLIPRDPIDAIEEGAGAWCDTIVGVTREEYGAFAFGNPAFQDFTEVGLRQEFERLFGNGAIRALAEARARRAPATPGALLSDLRSEEVFVRPNVRFARSQATNGARSYMYLFDWQSPRAGLGACHCIDLPFLFGNLDVWRAAPMLNDADPKELQDLSAVFQGALAAFAASGDPNGDGLPTWPEFQPHGRQLHFDRRVSAFATP